MVIELFVLTIQQYRNIPELGLNYGEHKRSRGKKRTVVELSVLGIEQFRNRSTPDSG